MQEGGNLQTLVQSWTDELDLRDSLFDKEWTVNPLLFLPPFPPDPERMCRLYFRNDAHHQETSHTQLCCCVPAKPIVPPSKPQFLRGSSGDGTVVVTWRAPADNGGARVRRYALSVWTAPAREGRTDIEPGMWFAFGATH